MTVKELIEALQTMPQDKEILIVDETGYWDTPSSVYIDKSIFRNMDNVVKIY